MAQRGDRGAGRLRAAFADAGRGLAAALRHEIAFRVEVAVAVVALPAALWLGTTAAERGLLIATAALVPLVELVNSAIEATVDRIGLEHDPLSGRAKDLGGAALLVSLALAATVWAVVLLS